MFESLSNSPFLFNLSLTLVHFLWQGLLVALILKLLLNIVDKKKSKLRYALAIFAMLANAILAIVTYSIVSSNSAVDFDNHLSHIALTNLVNELTQQNALFVSQQLLPSILANSLPYLSLLWLASVVILAVKLLIEIRNVNNLPNQSSVLPSATLSTRFEALAKQLQLTKTPRLLISLTVEVPMAIGWLKPVVLLPAAMVTGLTSAQLEMLILHELAHIRRHDYLVNFLQTVIELLFFFHPSVHWVGKQIRNEREYCSDDIAVQHCGDAIAYAHTLANTASLCAKTNIDTIPTMAMAASGGDLKARVLRLVDHHCAPSNHISKLLAALSILLVLLLLIINQLLTTSLAQPPSHQLSWQEPVSINESWLTNASLSTTLTTVYNSKKTTLETVQLIALPSQLKNNIADNTLAINKIQQIQKNSAYKLTTKPEIKSNVQPASQGSTHQDASVFTKKPTIAGTFKPVLSSTSNEEKQNDFSIAALENDNRPQPSAAPLLKKQLHTQHKATLNQTAFSNKADVSNQAITKIAMIKTTEKNLPKIITPEQPTKLDVEQTRFAVNKAIKTNNNKSNNLTEKPQSLINAQQASLIASPTQLSNKAALPAASSLDARLLTSINPKYPNLAKRRGIEVDITVDFTIDRNGKVKDINFVHQSKLIYFKSAIRSAMRQWRFKPAIKNNRKIESKMSKIFSFSLHA